MSCKDFRLHLTEDGEILKGWGQGARTPHRDPVVGKKTPPSSYLSMSRKYRKVDYDSTRNEPLPWNPTLCFVPCVPPSSQHVRSPRCRGPHTLPGSDSQAGGGAGTAPAVPATARPPPTRVSLLNNLQ